MRVSGTDGLGSQGYVQSGRVDGLGRGGLASVGRHGFADAESVGLRGSGAGQGGGCRYAGDSVDGEAFCGCVGFGWQGGCFFGCRGRGGFVLGGFAETGGIPGFAGCY